MQLATFDKANRSQQNLPQGKQTVSRLVNNTHDLNLKPDKIPHREFGLGRFALFFNRFYNALNGRFEEGGDVGSKKR